MTTNRIAVWIRAFRAPFLTASLVPVALGTAFAFEKGCWNFSSFSLALLGMCFLHIACNLCNDYFDHRNRTDWVNRTPTPFSGGSRIIQQGLIPAKQILIASIVCFIAGCSMGIYLCAARGWELLFIGISGVFLAFFYSAPPVWIAATGFGEFAVGIGFGVLPVMGAYFVQTASMNYVEVPLLSIPVTILIAAVVYINEFPDYCADREVKKNTIIVRLGTQKAVGIYCMMMVTVYIVTAFLLFLGILPLWGAAVFVTLPLALKNMKILKENHNNVEGIVAGNAGTIQLHLLIGVIMTLSIIVGKIF